MRIVHPINQLQLSLLRAVKVEILLPNHPKHAVASSRLILLLKAPIHHSILLLEVIAVQDRDRGVNEANRVQIPDFEGLVGGDAGQTLPIRREAASEDPPAVTVAAELALDPLELVQRVVLDFVDFDRGGLRFDRDSEIWFVEEDAVGVGQACLDEAEVCP